MLLTEARFDDAVEAAVAEMKQAESATTEFVAQATSRYRAYVTFRSNTGKQSWEAFFDFDALTGEFLSGVTPCLWSKSLDRFVRKMDAKLSEQRP